MMKKTKITTDKTHLTLNYVDALDRVEFCRHKFMTSEDLSQESKKDELVKIWSTQKKKIDVLISVCQQTKTADDYAHAIKAVKPLSDLLDTTPTWLLTGKGDSPYWFFATKTEETQWRCRRKLAAILLHRGVEDSSAVAAMTGLTKAHVQQVVTKGRGATAKILPTVAKALGVNSEWLQTGLGDMPEWFPEAQRWLRSIERDRGVKKSHKLLKYHLPSWTSSVQETWGTLLSVPTSPFNLGRLPRFMIDRAAIVRQDLVCLLDHKQLLNVAKCFRMRCPPTKVVENQMQYERKMRTNAAQSMEKIYADMELPATRFESLDYSHDLPDHPSELVGSCLQIAANKVKKPKHRREYLLRLRALLLAQPPNVAGLMRGLQRALTELPSAEIGGAVGITLRALVTGLSAAPDDETAEVTTKLGLWLLKTPVTDEPKWLLAEVVAVHRALHAAAAQRKAPSAWPLIDRTERLKALMSAYFGKVIHRDKLLEAFRIRELTAAELDLDLAAFKKYGVAYELLGGYWRFRD